MPLRGFETKAQVVERLVCAQQKLACLDTFSVGVHELSRIVTDSILNGLTAFTSRAILKTLKLHDVRLRVKGAYLTALARLAMSHGSESLLASMSLNEKHLSDLTDGVIHVISDSLRGSQSTPTRDQMIASVAYWLHDELEKYVPSTKAIDILLHWFHFHISASFSRHTSGAIRCAEVIADISDSLLGRLNDDSKRCTSTNIGQWLLKDLQSRHFFNSRSLSDFGYMKLLSSIVCWIDSDIAAPYIDDLIRWVYSHINPMNTYDSQQSRNVESAVTLLCSIWRSFSQAERPPEMDTVMDGFSRALSDTYNLTLFRYTRCNPRLSSCIRSARHFLTLQKRVTQHPSTSRSNSTFKSERAPSFGGLPEPTDASYTGSILSDSHESETDGESDDDEITLPDIDGDEVGLPGAAGLNIDVFRVFTRGSDKDLFQFLASLDARTSVAQLTQENRHLLLSVLEEIQQRSHMYSGDSLRHVLEWYVSLTTCVPINH